jgi:hypothetical protein
MRRRAPQQAFFPRLEVLEARDCPAFNIFYTSTFLLISGHPTLPFVNPGDGLQLHRLANGNLQVTEVGGATTINYGSYRPPTTVEVSLTVNTDHDLTVNLGGGRLPSNLLLSLGKGNTDVLAFHPINIVNGTLGGTLTILGGVGGEFINLGSLDGTTPVLIQGDTILSLARNQTPIGGDFLNVNAGSQLLGRLVGNEVDNITIGEPGIGPALVRKDVSLSVPVSGNVGKLFLLDGEVDGNVSFQGSPAINPVFSDSVVIGDAAAGTTGLVLGSLTAGLGNGTGDFEIQLGSTVNGNVSFTGALGDNEVVLDGTALSSVQMNLRSGDNDVEFGPLGFVGGNLSISAGDGNNDLTAFAGTVAGNLTFSLGNGNDSATITNAPGGRLFWHSGNGNDSLTLAPTTDNQTWNVNIQFGNGDDTFTEAGSGMGEVILGRVDGGGRITANVFVPGANWTPVPTFILTNFP